MFPVVPKPPDGYETYLLNRKTYLLHDTAEERLRSIPRFEPPPMLEGRLKELFMDQEDERQKLRTRHIVEKEKLVLSVEQVPGWIQFLCPCWPLLRLLSC